MSVKYNKRVLIIEDIRDTIEGTIAEFNYNNIEVDVARSVHEAIAFLKTKKYDGLIVDYWLPDDIGGDIIKNAGDIIINNLRNGKYSNLNINTEIIVYTAHLQHITTPPNSNSKIFSPVQSKLTPPVDIINLFLEKWKK